MRTHWRLALAAFCFIVLLLLAMQVMLRGPLLELDTDLAAWFAGHRIAWLTQAMLFVSAMHENEKVLAATALLVAWRGWRHDWRAVRTLLGVPFAMVLNVALKETFDRARPVVPDPVVQLATYSFPSGHAVAATVFYGIVCTLVFRHARSREVRLAAAAVAVLMVLLVTSSRLYLGAHFLTDVLAGMAEGTLCVLLFQRFLRVSRPARDSAGRSPAR